MRLGRPPRERLYTREGVEVSPGARHLHLPFPRSRCRAGYLKDITTGQLTGKPRKPIRRGCLRATVLHFWGAGYNGAMFRIVATEPRIPAPRTVKPILSSCCFKACQCCVPICLRSPTEARTCGSWPADSAAWPAGGQFCQFGGPVDARGLSLTGVLPPSCWCPGLLTSPASSTCSEPAGVRAEPGV